jgi:hypothetical protein
MLFQAVLLTITLALLLVTGLASFIVGVKRLFLERTTSSGRGWYQQSFIHIGIICMAAVAIILLEGFRGLLAAGMSTTNTLFSITEAIFLLCALISCAFLIRYFPYRRQQQIRG